MGCPVITAVDGMMKEGMTDPEVIAARVSKIHGKRVTPRRIASIMNRPDVIHGDGLASSGGESGASIWDLVADASAVSVEDQVIDRVDGSLETEIAARLAAMNLTPMERDLVVERLMALGVTSAGTPGVTTTRELARRHGVTNQAVSKEEARMAEKLRVLLGDLAA